MSCRKEKVEQDNISRVGLVRHSRWDGQNCKNVFLDNQRKSNACWVGDDIKRLLYVLGMKCHFGCVFLKYLL